MVDYDTLVSGSTSVEMGAVHMDRVDMIEALHRDGRFFIEFNLGEELTTPVPDFHLECWDLLTAMNILYIALALPRGHAKTTLCKLVCVWYLLFSPTRFVVYVSATANIASEACKDIIAYIQSPNFEQVFGKASFEVYQDGHGFYKFWLNVPDGRGGLVRKFCILKALGAGQQVRGLNIDNERPQLAVVDDLEDTENTNTKSAQEKLKKWFFGTFMKALSKKHKKVLYLGNMLSNQSILYYLCEGSQLWHSIRKGCLLSNGKPLWPEVWSYEAIQADYVEYQNMSLTALWMAEMMNMPMSEGSALISPDEITYFPPAMPDQVSTAFITLDPAISQKTWGNNSSLCVHGWVNDRWQIVETVSGKFNPDQLFFLIVELCLKWNTRCVGVEQGAFELALRFIWEILMKAHNQSFGIYKINHKNVAKTERLAAWCSALRKKLWVLTQGEHALTQQLINYDPLKSNNIDDDIDSASMGITMINAYMPEIMNQFKFLNTQFTPTRVVGN
jgi:hypothetical protein